MQTANQGTSKPGLHVVPQSEGAGLLRECVKDGGYWFLIIDSTGRSLLERTIRAHYEEAPVSDLFCVIAPSSGSLLAVNALAKSRMTAQQFQEELRAVNVFLSEHEITRRGAVTATSRARAGLAMALSDELLSDPALPKSPSAKPGSWH